MYFSQSLGRLIILIIILKRLWSILKLLIEESFWIKRFTETWSDNHKLGKKKFIIIFNSFKRMFLLLWYTIPYYLVCKYKIKKKPIMHRTQNKKRISLKTLAKDTVIWWSWCSTLFFHIFFLLLPPWLYASREKLMKFL